MRSNRYIEREKRHMDNERGFGHGSLWKKGEISAFTQVGKKKSQGDIDLTQTTGSCTGVLCKGNMKSHSTLYMDKEI